ncbi:MAG: 2-oxo-4-hydroxy-4-carboxy-5-ureidoimidazoline decarboxylase [Candidatus Sulfopaludibacter sp.]|nr:2-oxo-4-hydroxy-4-carboxy-5-ureidoimidazoline decarboxylase [Candidatus Sulfopaludibacter sp.]
MAGIDCLTRERFVETLGLVFEDSPWVAERAWAKRPFSSVKELHAVMTAEVESATHEEQLALLRAHPDLGARARMSEASTGEQAGAGLDQLTPQEFETLQQFNGTYRRKFGFPFLYAVKGAAMHDILVALAVRLDSQPEEEFRQALWEVYRIAWFRLEALVGG